MSKNILIIEDDACVAGSLCDVLKIHGYNAQTAATGEEALPLLENQLFDVALIDLRLPCMTGLDALRHIRSEHPSIDCVMITSYATVETAVEAMKLGATEYLTKPINDDELQIVLTRVFENRHLRIENETLKKKLIGQRTHFHDIIGEDHAMQKIYSIIEAISNTDTTVLIKGESGTGKGVIAQAIHKNDPRRKNGPYVEVSCGAIPRELLESELFGHVKGAFTSAVRDRIGRFEMANGGTILLDEIDALPPYLQVKLLRILQQKTFEMVGGTETKRTDVRIIAATNRGLDEEIASGNFREDLYYRLNVITIEVPPLRQRKDDIPTLVRHFLTLFNEKTKRHIKGITKEAMRVLMDCDWPGNVRELENTLERVVVLSKDEFIKAEDIPDYILKNAAVRSSPLNRPGSLKDGLKIPEKKLILQALEQSDGNKKKAARILNINRTTLYNKMREHQLI